MSMKQTAWLCILILAGVILPPDSANAAGPAPAAEAFEPGRVRLLDGPFKTVQELHRTGMVGQLEPDRLLFNFRKLAGLPQPAGVTRSYGGWDDGFVRGHYAGHYLSAAASMYAATGDASFRDKANYMVKVLAECQEKLGGGYLSAFPATWFDNLEANPRRSSVPYYTIHKILAGLLDVHALCGNPQALEIAARMSDYFVARIAKLTPEQIEAMFRTDYSGNPGNEFGGMAESLTDLTELARKAGDLNAARHLKLAGVFNRPWFVDPLAEGKDKLSGLHGNTHAAQAVGLARFAQVAGDERTGKAAASFWRMVVNDHSFVNGGNSFNEKLRDAGTEVAGKGDAALSPLTAESCNTYNMLKLTWLLFERRPSVAYADYYENALYNHILSSIEPDHGRVMYYMSMRPGDYRIHINEPFCCQGTGIEHAARLGEAIYCHKDRSLWVNLFIASTLDWSERGVKLRMETRYPESGAVKLTMKTSAPVEATIHLRIPGWLEGPVVVKINGARQSDAAAAGEYVALARTWNDADAIELELPLSVRVRPSKDDPGTVSFFYGPVLLAGQLGRGGMPESDVAGNNALAKAPAWPVPVLIGPASAALASIKPVVGQPLEFEARMVNPADRKEVAVRLAPLYRVQHQRYALYWKAAADPQRDGDR
ncbi:MAG: glycoside hydrolase family 127 protein [Planctomycetota bacterium]|nr:glycoside hydrolase family 127 protein [Planctomycetota bacterium]